MVGGKGSFGLSGGGVPCLEGAKEGALLGDPWRLARSGRAPFSWLDSLDDRGCSTIIPELWVEDGRCSIALGVDIIWGGREGERGMAGGGEWQLTTGVR